MTATRAAVPALPSLDKIEMEDRKRSLVADPEDLAPSRKRFKDDNGATMRMADDKEKEVEDYQKDAIMRQMKEYKRMRKDADDRVLEFEQKTRYHDDHLRVLDAWYAQLLDELRVLASQMLPTPPPSSTTSAGEEMYNSALLFEDSEVFSLHLKARSDSIKSTISELFGRLPSASADVEDLRKQLNDLLAKEKEYALELRTTLDEKDSLNKRLELAVGRYMTAERKLDRAKSSQVLKLEKQAIMGGNADNASPTTSKAAVTPKGEHPEANGELENGTATAEVEAQRKEALAVAEKHKSQLEEVEAENERLTNDLSAARTKVASLSDDDYAETALCKTLKLQYEDVVKRINDLEATNVRLREEVQKYQAERTAYRSQLDEENRVQTSEIEAANARAETDLARIRHTRDQMSSEIAILKSSEENSKTSSAQIQELAEARDLRIGALESQVQRLELQLGEAEPASLNLDGLDLDTLQGKLRTLENQYSLLSNELPSMETAWKKTQAMASKKIEEMTTWEDQIARLNAEKAKADQKYFAAMKAKDMREAELRALKTQNARSSEIVTQLKDGEAKTKELCSNYERQLADTKEAVNKLEASFRFAEQKLKEATTTSDGLKKSVDELKTLITAKDKDNLTIAKSKRQTEEELERCKTQLDEARKQYDSLKKSRAAVSNNDSDDWRRVAICPMCHSNIRNTALKLCGHVICNVCVKQLIQDRNRKCPSCGKSFGTNDHMGITLA